MTVAVATAWRASCSRPDESQAKLRSVVTEIDQVQSIRGLGMGRSSEVKKTRVADAFSRMNRCGQRGRKKSKAGLCVSGLSSWLDPCVIQ